MEILLNVVSNKQVTIVDQHVVDPDIIGVPLVVFVIEKT